MNAKKVLKVAIQKQLVRLEILNVGRDSHTLPGPDVDDGILRIKYLIDCVANFVRIPCIRIAKVFDSILVEIILGIGLHVLELGLTLG